MRDTVSLLPGKNLSVAAFLKQPARWKDSVLGVLCFSADAVENRISDMGVPCMRAPMRSLDAGHSICEVWHGRGQLTRGTSGAIHYLHADVCRQELLLEIEAIAAHPLLSGQRD